MIKFDSIKLHRYHFFNDAEFKFNDGINLIQGENGSGKSLLFSAIPTMLSLIHEDKRAWENPPKGSELDFRFSNDKNSIDYNILTNSSAKFSLAVNGNDLQPHKRKDAKALLERQWTIPHDLFHSTVFLRGTSTHPLTTGTAGTRSTWLAHALDLTSTYDSLKAQIDERLKEISFSLNKISTLDDELKHALAQMPESSISKKQALKAERLLTRHRHILKNYPQRISQLETAIKAIDNIIELPDIEESLDSIQDRLDKVRLERVRLLKIADKYEEAANAKEHNADIKAKIAKLKDKGLDKSKNLELLKQRFDKQERIVERYVSDKQAYDEQAEDSLLWQGIKDMKPQTRNLEEAEELLSALVYRGTQQQDTIDALNGLDADAKICPTCGNKLTRNHITHETIRLTRELNVLPKEIKRIKLEIRYWKLKKRKFISVPQKPSFSSKEHEQLERSIELLEQYQSLKRQLVEEEDVPDNVGQALEDINRKVKKLDKRRMQAVNLQAYKGMLPQQYKEYSREQLSDTYDLLTDEITKLKSARQRSADIVDKYSETALRYETQRKLQKQHSSTVNRLREEIANLKDEAKDFEAWKALSVAYGNSGVRLYHMRESAKILSDKLTELSSLFFNTTYKFDIEVAPYKLSVNAERKGKVGSIKTLSGAESRCWTLLCAMALIRILPSSLRCDTMILDEIEANMNKKTRQRYVRDVLPELRTIVPKIVVVTPLMDGELPIHADYSYTVVNNRIDGHYQSKLLAN